MPAVTTQSLCSLNNSPKCEVHNLVQEIRPEEKQQQLALKFPGDKNASCDEARPRVILPDNRVTCEAPACQGTRTQLRAKSSDTVVTPGHQSTELGVSCLWSIPLFLVSSPPLLFLLPIISQLFPKDLIPVTIS